jgi:hypothetical protein
MSAAKTKEKDSSTVTDDTQFFGAKGSESTALTKDDYDLDDLGAGFEDTSAVDFKLPWLRPLQKGSPQVDPDSAAYIEGAKPGMFINTATWELVDGKTGFKFIPVHRRHEYIEYVPRDQGGGFVAASPPDDPRVVSALKAFGNKRGKAPIGDGNELVETFNMFGLYIPEDTDKPIQPVVIPFTSSGIDAYKSIMTKLDMLRVSVEGRAEKARLPMFASTLRVTTRFTENKKGSWHKIQMDFDGGSAEKARVKKDNPLYAQAKMFRNLVVDNKAVVEHEASGVSEEVAAEMGSDNKGAF